MRIIGLHVDGYGILHDFTLDGGCLDGRPTVLFGPNEVGKSTLLSFIRGVLFGFKAEGKKAEPVRGGRTGGWLLIEDGGDVFRVHRTGGGDGRVVVELPDGSKEGEQFLRDRLLRGVNPVLFKNVFAVGMEELRKLDDLKREEVSSYVYGAGTGVRPEKLAGAANALESSALQLFNPRGRVQELNRILKELDGVDKRIRQLERQPEEYFRLKDELAGLEEERERLRDERRELQRRAGRLESLLKARDPWLKMKALTSRLEELTPVEDFPEDGIARLEQLMERKNGRLEVARRCAAAIENLNSKLTGTAVDAGVLSQGAAIRGLSDDRSLYVKKRQELVEEEAAARQLEEQVRRQMAELGPQWDEEGVLNLDLSLAVRRQVEDFDRRFRAQEEALGRVSSCRESLQRELNEKSAALREIEDELSRLPQRGESRFSLDERFNALEGLARDLQRQSMLGLELKAQRDRLEDLGSRKEFAEENLGSVPAPKPAWSALAVVALGLVGLAVFGLSAAGLFMLVGAAGLAVLVGFILSKVNAESAARRERFRRELESIAAEMEQVRDRIDRLVNELKEVEARIGEAAEVLGEGGGVDLGSLPDLRRKLEREREDLRRREELVSRKVKADRLLAEVREAFERAERDEEREREGLARLAVEWEQWCDARGLPDLRPVDMVSFFNLADRVKENTGRLRTIQDRCRQIAAFIDDYVDRVNRVAGALGMEPATRESADVCVARLEELLEEHRSREAVLKKMQEDLERIKEEERAVDTELREIEESINSLLVLGGAGSEEEFRTRAALHAEWKEIGQEIGVLREQLLLIAGSESELEEMIGELVGSTRADNEEELEQVRSRLDDLDDRINELNDEIAEKRLRVEQMESGEDLARARQEKSMLEQLLARKARQWRILKLCASFLAMAREKHERERQPGVLLKASEYLFPMTEGRYTRVIAPVGAPDHLEVERPNGERVAASDLSRGAAGQLYLSLRLALAVHYGTLSGPLPLMLDDVMVDFDRARLEGAVRVLGEIAGEHQVLLFTCHQHILDAVARLLPDYRCVILPGTDFGQGSAGA